MRGRRVGSRPRFQRLWNSFQAIWKAMNVLPVPVASVSRMRVCVRGDGLQHALDGDVLVVAALDVPPLSSKGTAAKRSRQAFGSAKVRFQSSSGVG